MPTAYIEAAIVNILTSDNAVDAIVGSDVFPEIALQDKTLPYITYNQITGERTHVTSGATGLAAPVYQINCWAKTYGGARILAQAVRIALNGFSGTVETLSIQTIILTNEGDIDSLSPGVDQLRRFGKRLDITVWFVEPTS